MPTPVVNKYAVDRMKEWERGESKRLADGRIVNTRKQVNVVAVDYYNYVDFSLTDVDTFVKTAVEMNVDRLPVWQNRGSLPPGINSELAVRQNHDGRPEVFATGADGKLWTNFEKVDGTWSGWSVLKEVSRRQVTLRGAEASNR